MKIGFTGTRQHMTIYQWQTVEEIMAERFPMTEACEFHHGDAIGADAQATDVALRMRAHRNLTVHCHPSTYRDQRAYKEYDTLYPEKAPLVRNREIVAAVDLMIASPYEYDERTRGSGTWATMRHARSQKVELIVVWPDGSKSDGWD